MSWMNSIGNLLSEYRSTGSAPQPPPNVNGHFDQVAQAAPPSAIAEGLAAAFRSNQTPAFGQMLGNLFAQSNGEQKAGLLNHLLGAVGAGNLAQILSGAGLGGLLSGGNTQANAGSGNTQITPEQAEKISPDVVQQMATHAEKLNPSVVDSVSNFYAQHTTLVKTIGGAALAIALGKMAEREH